MSVFLHPIYTQTVTAASVSSITFNNIPQGFTDLVIDISARSATSTGNTVAWQYAGFRLNNNTTANSTRNSSYAYGTGSSGGDFNWNQTGIAEAVWYSNQLATSSTFGTARLTIYDYTSANHKNWICDAATFTMNTTNGGQLTIATSGTIWINDPVTSITFIPIETGANFLQNTTITLYGVSSRYASVAPVAPTIGTITDLGGIASVSFTANDSSVQQSANNYSAQDITIMSNPIYSKNSPVRVPITTGVTYNLPVSANNSVGSSISSSASITSYNNYSSIATATPNNSSVAFSNIPQDYKHLQLRIFARTSGAGDFDTMVLRFNGDTNSNYMMHWIFGDGTSASYGNSTPSTTYIQIRDISASGSLANSFGAFIVDIYDYASVLKIKTVRTMGGYDTNSTGKINLQTGTWNSTTPISSITLAGGNAAFIANSHVALYGIS